MEMGLGKTAAGSAAPRRRGGTVYLVGVDSMSPDVIDELLRQGRLPNIAEIRGTGCMGRLETSRPTTSAMIWATMATGRHFRGHGIDGFTHFEILGKRVSRRTVSYTHLTLPTN